MKTQCHKCGKVFKTKSEYVGRVVHCHNCGQPFEIVDVAANHESANNSKHNRISAPTKNEKRHQPNLDMQDNAFDHFRRAYIGDDNSKYGRYFNLFDATNGKFWLTWTWSAFISPPCWLAYKKLYWLIPLSYVLTIGSIVIFFEIERQLYFAWSDYIPYSGKLMRIGYGLGVFVFWLLCSIPVRIAIGTTGIWFYWRHIKAKINRTKLYYPNDTGITLNFLKSEGHRTNLFLLFALFYFIIPVFSVKLLAMISH